jgi:uncharacterized protein YaiE (UPF0345 family)
MKKIVLVASLLFLSMACKKEKTENVVDQNQNVQKDTLALNTLSDSEKEEGWELLFDGKTIEGWHKYGTDSIGKAWVINDNSLHLEVSDKEDWQAANGGDIISAKEYANFHLKLDWKISKDGNSGVIFYIHEDANQYKFPWMTGPEMQVLDNEGHPDSKIIKHRAGDLYDLITSKETVKPAEEWNHAEIISNKGNLQFFLNGEKVVETTMWDDAWKKMIAGSKFHEFPGFGTYKTGKIGLQDHGNNVWFRNIKIKEIK